MSTVMPCQVLWMSNKVKDWKDGLRRYSSCTLENGKRLVCVQKKDGIPSDEEVIATIQEACAKYCPYAMDEEKILADRNAYVYIEGAENETETEEPAGGTTVEPTGEPGADSDIEPTQEP